MVKPAVQKPAERSDSKYKGVRKRKWGKFVSEIRLPNSRERIWLGSYDTAEKAARAFDAALFCLRGRSAKFNFPDNPPEICGGRSLTRAGIQTAAARFANSEPPKTHSNIGSMNDSHVESPSPSVVSEGTVQLDSEGTEERSLFDLYSNMVDGEGAEKRSLSDLYGNMDSGNYGSDVGMFPEFDVFFNDFLNLPLPAVDYIHEDLEVVPQDSFLWNF